MLHCKYCKGYFDIVFIYLYSEQWNIVQGGDQETQ